MSDTQTPDSTTAATDEHGAPELFSGDDLAVLEGRTGAPRELAEAVGLLVTFALGAPTCSNSNPCFGRFDFCEHEKTAAQTRALFRMVRVAVDWLEADYLSCEEEEMQHFRDRLAAFGRLRGGGE